MFKLYSRTCEYVIRALSHVVDEPFSPSALCEQAGIKDFYARKAFQALSRAGVLKAATGPKGGYRFARDPGQITLLEIVGAVEGEDHYRHCVLGLPECGGSRACALHHLWEPVKKDLLTALEETSVKDLTQKTKENDYVHVLSPVRTNVSMAGLRDPGGLRENA